MRIYGMQCQSCGNRAPTHRVFLVQHIGVLIVFFHKRISGNFCRKCVDRYFGEYFFTTLFLGWWGLISFFATPVVLIIDLINYVSAVVALRPSPNEHAMASPAEARDAASAEPRFTLIAFSTSQAAICPASTCRRPLRLPAGAHGLLKCRSCGHTFTWWDRARVARRAATLVLIAVVLGAFLLWIRPLTGGF